MGSKYPSGFYDDETVDALAQAFREVWKTIMANDPFRNIGRDEMLRQTIVETMMQLATKGVRSVDELRDRTLAVVVTPYDLPEPPKRARRPRSHKAAPLRQ